MKQTLWTAYRTLEKRLPEKWILVLTPFLYKVFSAKRRRSSMQFSFDGQVCVATCNASSSVFYFAEAIRCPRYLHKNGVQWRIQRILDKYSFGDVCIEPNDVVIDVGANVGEFALGAARVAKKVFCFEPDRACLPALEKNAKQIAEIEIDSCAVSAGSGEIQFFKSTSTADSSTIQPEEYTSVETVESVCLDDFCSRNNIEVIDFLKIEAEGAEPEVLEGASNLLAAARIRKIAIDAGPERHGLPTVAATKQSLISYGYEVCERNFIVFGIHRAAEAPA